MPGDPHPHRFEKPDEPSRQPETVTDTQYSVLTEIKTASGSTVAYSEGGTCILTDPGGTSIQGRWTTDPRGNRNFYFDCGPRVCLTQVGTVIEVAPAAGAVETSTLLTPEGVLVKTHGKEVSTKLPNGVVIDERRQITDRIGTHSPDSVTIDPDGTRNYCLKKGGNTETIYSVGKDGTASVAERLYARSVLLSEKKTKWTANAEQHIKTRQLDSEIKIRGMFAHIDDKEVFCAPDGFTVERTPGGTLTIKVGNKTRTLNQGILRIKSDISGEEIEYNIDSSRRDPGPPGHAHAKEPPAFSFSDGTTLSYVTVSGDRDKTEHSQCIYLSMPNNQAGRDHFFTRPHSHCFAFVSTSVDAVLPPDYDFQFSRKIFDD
jgi:hypothetical protein